MSQGPSQINRTIHVDLIVTGKSTQMKEIPKNKNNK